MEKWKESGQEPISPFEYSTETDFGDFKVTHYGLTKREYFAGLAMQGLISDTGMSLEEVAKTSVAQADILLKELEKTQSND